MVPTAICFKSPGMITSRLLLVQAQYSSENHRRLDGFINNYDKGRPPLYNGHKWWPPTRPETSGLFFLFICSTKGNHDENDEATATANTSTRNDRWGAQFLFPPSELKSVIASVTLLWEARYKEFRHRKERLDAVSHWKEGQRKEHHHSKEDFTMYDDIYLACVAG